MLISSNIHSSSNKEDAHTRLFGFMEKSEREIFKMLSVSGIGT
jgi:Holliday junction resolvasome RuvABC DNA-binding subunit